MGRCFLNPHAPMLPCSHAPPPAPLRACTLLIRITSVRQPAEKSGRSGATQQALLEELKQLAVRLGFEVREEKLLREVGYRVRSGSCRVHDTHVILLDRGLPPTAQIDILVEELAGQRLDDLYVSPAVRQLLERATARAAAAAMGDDPTTGGSTA